MPLVIVPTAYRDLSEGDIIALGKVKLVSYASHAIPAAVTGMEKAFAQIRRASGLRNADREIVPVQHIFDLQGVGDMNAPERRFLR